MKFWIEIFIFVFHLFPVNLGLKMFPSVHTESFRAGASTVYQLTLCVKDDLPSWAQRSFLYLPASASLDLKFTLQQPQLNTLDFKECNLSTQIV